MDDDPANVAANWASYFDDENQCNYYYNSVTQESSWSRPACMGFGKTSSSTPQPVMTKDKSSSLLAAAFGLDDTENENEDINYQFDPEAQLKSPPPPSDPSPKKRRQSSMDSNDEFFAQLEEEVEAVQKNTSEEELAKQRRLQEEADAARQAKLDQIAAEEKKAREETEAKLTAEREAKEKADKEAKAKRQAELEKIVAEKKRKEAEALKQKAEKEQEEARLRAIALENEQQRTENEMNSDDTADEIDEDDDAMLYTAPLPKEDVDDCPVEIEEEEDVKVVQDPVDSNEVPSSEVVDAVQCNEAATKIQSVQRRRVAKQRAGVLKKASKQKKYDEFMAKQEEKERDLVVASVKSSQDGVSEREEAKVESAAVTAAPLKESDSKKDDGMKAEKDIASVKLKSLHKHKRRVSKQQDDGDIVLKNDSDSATATAHSKPRIEPHAKKSIEITEITTQPPINKSILSSKPAIIDPPTQNEVNRKDASEVHKVMPLPRKSPRNHPKKAIEEAAKFLAAHDNASPDAKPTVPETRSEELKFPVIDTSSKNVKPAPRRKNRGGDLKHVNKRTTASLEKLETVSKLITPPLESQSAPPNGRLPDVDARRVGATGRKKKKKEPLFMRLEAQGRALSLAIEKEKREQWQKIKESKKEAKPSKEAILEHMTKYEQQRKAHENKEKEYATAKKKEWTEHAKLLKLKNKSPPRKKLINDSEIHSPSSKVMSDALPKKSPVLKKVTPRKVKKKLLKGKKLDFIDEEKERRAQEEQARKDRLAKGKLYGKLAPAKHANNASPPRKRLNLIDDVAVPSAAPPDDHAALSVMPSPRHRSPRASNDDPVKRVQTSGDDVDSTEVGDIITSPQRNIRKKPGERSLGSKHGDHNSDTLSPVLSIPKRTKKSPVTNRLSSMEDSNNSCSVPNINIPYDGKVGSEWVSHIMEMDTEEGTLADVYESGFEMFMMEKGIIQDDELV